MKFCGILFLNFIAEIPYIAIIATDSDFKISVLIYAVDFIDRILTYHRLIHRDIGISL